TLARPARSRERHSPAGHRLDTNRRREHDESAAPRRWGESGLRHLYLRFERHTQRSDAYASGSAQLSQLDAANVSTGRARCVSDEDLAELRPIGVGSVLAADGRSASSHRPGADATGKQHTVELHGSAGSDVRLLCAFAVGGDRGRPVAAERAQPALRDQWWGTVADGVNAPVP